MTTKDVALRKLRNLSVFQRTVDAKKDIYEAIDHIERLHEDHETLKTAVRDTLKHLYGSEESLRAKAKLQKVIGDEI